VYHRNLKFPTEIPADFVLRERLLFERQLCLTLGVNSPYS